ncbi:hypothetical protein C8A03DRAFT_36363 [Achaetomium macrosporum]|uniref:Putative lipoate-protein ligase A n=1 Tax=Achaetomium macrosporum TaxID=79813 RepID=A0AAN7C6Q4_9PEZI|nr:hypothetical protein C8A03DRAFT_36363 [Achaetomium macrosporum]
MAGPSRLAAITRRISSSPYQSHSHPKIVTWPAQTRPYTQYLSRPLQIYRSTSTDPYLNLSIEHHLLQRSHPDSTILFLYTNRPSVVIGRNQNPWLEVNLHLLRQGLPPSAPLDQQQTPSADTHGGGAHIKIKTIPVSLVRRRSGGGTVFHDAGNTNWSVICPPAVFDRDRHAEMVVRALRRLGVDGVRVNGRHDIVMDVDAAVGRGYGGEEEGKQTFKVSGSAYKLTRTRSLHHGTCLLRSENLGRVSGLLRSPAEGFIKARGVESVRSPIRNVGVGGEEFADAVIGEFRRMYGGEGAGDRVVVCEEEALMMEDVVKGLRELTSPDWIFGQTPQFTFSTHPTEDDPRERPRIEHSLPYGLQAHFTVRHGDIQSAAVSGLEYQDSVDEASQNEILSKALVNQHIHHIKDWRTTLKQASPSPVDVDDAGEWLNHIFGIQTPGVKGDRSLAETTIEMIAQTKVAQYLSQNSD